MTNGYHEDPSAIEHDPSKARREALSAILLLLLLLLILLLVAAATERTDILRFAGAMIAPGSVLAFQPRFSAAAVTTVAGATTQAAQSRAVAPVVQQYDVDALFRTFYEQRGGTQLFGQPLSPLVELNGRRVQWYERARLEYWPELGVGAGSVQLGRIGAEYVAAIDFPTQRPFADHTGARFFPPTQHGVVDPFLAYWEQVGGVETLGYPISEQVQETLADGLIYTVQYFERGRVELHPALDGGQPALRLGALGNALYLDKSPPKLVRPARPTPVPVP